MIFKAQVQNSKQNAEAEEKLKEMEEKHKEEVERMKVANTKMKDENEEMKKKVKEATQKMEQLTVKMSEKGFLAFLFPIFSKLSLHRTRENKRGGNGKERNECSNCCLQGRK